MTKKEAIDTLKLMQAQVEWDYPMDYAAAIDMAIAALAEEPEAYKDKLKEIADALSEKFAYMNTCLNERDIILGYLGVKRPSKTHCNTDCTNIKCESHHCNMQEKIKDDTISRQAAIDVAIEAADEWDGGYSITRANMIADAINNIAPSAQPERKTGRWIEEKCYDTGFWTCSKCKFTSEASGANILYKFCPNCGADMRGEQDG